MTALFVHTGCRNNQLGDLGVKAITRSLPQLKNLEALFLNSNNIKGEEGVAAGIVAAVNHLPALQTIWLDQNEMEDSSKNVIQSSLQAVSGLRI